MRVLVTGGAGYIGSVTVQHLLHQGYEVEVLDDLSTGHRQAVAPTVRFHQGSLLDETCLAAVFARPFDAVVHFAAFSQVAESVQDPLKYYHNNVGGTLALLGRVCQGGAGLHRARVRDPQAVTDRETGVVDQYEVDVDEARIPVSGARATTFTSIQPDDGRSAISRYHRRQSGVPGGLRQRDGFREG